MTKMNNMNNGMMVICGNSIEELENDLNMMKLAMASGKTMAVGGTSLEDVEQGMEALSKMLGGSAPVVPSAPSVPIIRGKDEWVLVCDDDDDDDDEWEDDDDDDDDDDGEIPTVGNYPSVGASIVARMIEAYEKGLNNN